MEAPVLIRVEDGVGRITLNRPEALHALNTDMCQRMYDALMAWADDDTVHLLMIDHREGTRGFCAGGDIRMVARSGRADGRDGEQFFNVEYRLNTRIKRFPKPYVAILDGVTMGGGVGISIHGSHRIATENTLFAMPETGIGLFPDVGGGWFLPRLSGQIGTWLALTGARLKGRDVLAAGIATHYMPSAAVETLKSRLCAARTHDDIDAILADYAEPAGHPSYAEHLATINQCFAKPTVTDICLALKMADEDWATAQADILKTRSPLSMAVALEQLRRGEAMSSFEDVMRMEYRIACHIIRGNDFSEGVRAAIEDKDHAPKWSPDTPAGVTPQMVAALFAPVAEELQL
ncbi:enoyl-CoA hydratase/isomerase family protein [Asticcacaulis sp. 201]|uniref:enoyl-CoA hydratase/isomerase family protein n=1 Tax=Asticcacaulis sp. 201 TaxID=3028787 RepID=UPI002915F8D0|nr:enoyl-CoA hydratase/isomerase family protein [Asticcacaulis sp. 201]MDV6333124.1 enoyl-CoA hydratase/isomerase family protein [Asticcacaulis sp. 201]